MAGVWCRIRETFRRYGPLGVMFKAYVAGMDRWFDLRYGVDTCGCIPLSNLNIIGENRDRGYRYEPARAVILRRLFAYIRPMVPKEGAIVDLGGGKGRSLLIASEFKFPRATSVEFARELCEVAARNCAAYKQATGVATEFRIVESDVVAYECNADDSVFLMFNPFDGVVIEEVLNRIDQSYRKSPRKILICYYNPQFNSVIDRHSFLTKVTDLNYWGYCLSVYSSA